MTSSCVFCQIVRGESPATVVTKTGDCTIIEPLNPVTDGHVLVIPNRHVQDALADPFVTGNVMEVAAHFAKHPEYHARPNESVNLITSVGAAATQSVLASARPRRAPQARRRADAAVGIERGTHAPQRRDGSRVLQRAGR